MEYLPIFVDLKHKPCLVIGGGDIAYRKIKLLQNVGASITCVTQKANNDIRKLADDNYIFLEVREFSPQDIDNKILVISATNHHKLNEKIAKLTRAKNIWVNVVDNPSLCSFITPAIIDRDPITIAVASGGASPVLSRLLRAKIESMIPAAYGQLAMIAKEFRQAVKNKFSTINKRRIFWEQVFHSNISEEVFIGNHNKAKAQIQHKLDNSNDDPIQTGEVYLVGGGPGDPDLLTFKALRLIQQADVVLYDRLVSNEVMNLVRRDVQRIYVGKERGNHAVPQGGINQLLVDLAKQGRRVCRLKGGDPFIFGRGGEEIETLAQNNIPFQVVPGITAASGCASYSGIPLTHRDYSQSCRFVTGHLKDGTMNLPWDELAIEQQTIVFYMGLVGAKYLSKQLIKHGMREDIAVALIEKGTTPEHKVYVTDLVNLPHIVENNDIHAPTLIIIGDVVKLRDKLNWFKKD